MQTIQRWTIAGIFFAALSTTLLYAQEPLTDTEPMWRVCAMNGLVYVRKSDQKKDKHTWIADKVGNRLNAVLGSPQETKEDIRQILGSYELRDLTASELFGSNGQESKTFKFSDAMPAVNRLSSPFGNDYRADFSISEKDAIRDGVPIYSPIGSPTLTASLTVQSSGDHKNLQNLFEGNTKTIQYNFTPMDGFTS